MPKEISIIEVKKHRSRKSTWIILHNEVYDVTSFLHEHPGGEDSLLDVAGKDGTLAFEDVGHSEDARQLLKKYKIGTLPISEFSKPVATCCKIKPRAKSCPSCTADSCPSGNIKSSNKDKSWRTFDGSSSSSRPEYKKRKEPPTPKAEKRVQSIVVPRERRPPRPRGQPCGGARRRVCPPPPPQSSNLKWAIIALAGAIIIGIALKKYMG